MDTIAVQDCRVVKRREVVRVTVHCQMDKQDYSRKRPVLVSALPVIVAVLLIQLVILIVVAHCQAAAQEHGTARAVWPIRHAWEPILV